ncbi:MAG: methylmalonyl-CoA mutase [Latescibacteria bacterium DG_63]|nr:MAG: methylmalonyl-CoA mutase [Latescibacteria bacterium DG_63]
MRDAKKKWQERYKKSSTERDALFESISGVPLEPLYAPDDIEGLDYLKDLGFPGEYPFTRGVRHNMYRGRLWTMRQFSGLGTAMDSNRRFHFLLERGQTGLSVAFHMPTIMGVDSDNPRARGEVGRCGVAIDSLEDMEVLFDGIPLDKVSTSMTINAPASILLAFYIGVAEKQGVGPDKISGTIQNDILKEYIAQKSWIFPPEPSMRIITDILAFCSEHVPRWNTISISGYHIREAGSTAAQELAFTLADGLAYVEAGVKAGLEVDTFAPRLSFFFDAHLDFFEEIAKFRAARRIWAREMKERFGAKKRESLLLRFHTQTAGCSLTAQQPENNIVRTAYEALSGVLGGTQSLHTNSMDETLALPTEKAAQIALRTQQIIAFESGVADTIDPLAGSYYVESLTNRLEKEAYDYFEKIERLGGVVKAIDKGFFQKEISDAAYRYQKEIEEKKRTIVGVNDYVLEDEKIEIPVLKIDPEVERIQVQRLKALRERRDGDLVSRRLEALKKAAEGSDNVMPLILDAARAYATLGEIIDVLKGVFGEYKEIPIF